MVRRVGLAALLTGASVVGVTLASTPPVSADLAVVARWDMNEASDATVMVDSGPVGIDGAIGDDIEVRGDTYFWSTINWFTHPATEARNVVVPHDPALNPGLESFSIEIRYRSDDNYGNIVQKGQNGNPTGAWKLEHPWGFPGCAFKDDTGLLRGVTARTQVWDGDWHVVRCELDRDFGEFGRLRVIIDGEVDQVNVLDEPFGAVANDQPVSIGGKVNCDQITITCDYFWGEIDYIEIRSGAAPPTTTTTTSTTTPSTTTTSTTTTTVASRPPVVGDGIATGASAGAVASRGERTLLD